MPDKKVRVQVPAETAAAILFDSDRTCCVCHVAGKQVQIHHIDDNPSNNARENLALLCLECHAQTQITGGFGRSLNANLVVLYRDHWLTVVEMRRSAESLESELRKGSSGSRPANDQTSAIVPKEDRHASPSPDSIGRTFRHLGIAITLVDATWSFSLDFLDSGYEYDEQEQPGDGVKFVTISTRVLNDSQGSIDITCSRPIDDHLIDDRGRSFASIGSLYHIPGNPGCNYQLNPGFTVDMKWIYRVPLDAVISAFEFEDWTEIFSGRDRAKGPKPTRIPVMLRPVAE